MPEFNKLESDFNKSFSVISWINSMNNLLMYPRLVQFHDLISEGYALFM